MFEKVDFVIEQLSQILPNTFPTSISESIFNGLKAARDKLKA